MSDKIKTKFKCVYQSLNLDNNQCNKNDLFLIFNYNLQDVLGAPNRPFTFLINKH